MYVCNFKGIVSDYSNVLKIGICYFTWGGFMYMLSVVVTGKGKLSYGVFDFHTIYYGRRILGDSMAI